MKIDELAPALWRALADARGHERTATGRRILVLTALFHLLDSMDERMAVHSIRAEAVHARDLPNLQHRLTDGGLRVEANYPELSGILVSPLLDDALHGGASLFRQVGIASTIYEELAATDPGKFGAWFDLALDEIAQGPALGEAATSRPLARLMLALAKVERGQSLLDPAAGMGTVLSEASGNGARLFGQEINLVSYALARLRLHLKGAEARIELGDSLLAPASFGGALIPKFDRIVCDPPLGAARDLKQTRSENFEFLSSRLETLFVQHCLRSLAPAGRAVILVGQGLLVRRGAEADLRAALAGRRALEGVVTLPAGVMPWVGISLAILMLRGSAIAAEDPAVTFLNAADLPIDARRGGERLNDEIIEKIVEAYHGEAGHLISKGSVEVDGAAAGESLLPSRYLPKPKVARPDLSVLRQELKTQEDVARSAAERLDQLYPYLKLSV